MLTLKSLTAATLCLLGLPLVGTVTGVGSPDVLRPPLGTVTERVIVPGVARPGCVP